MRYFVTSAMEGMCKDIIALPWPLAVGDNMLTDVYFIFFGILVLNQQCSSKASVHPLL